MFVFALSIDIIYPGEADTSRDNFSHGIGIICTYMKQFYETNATTREHSRMSLIGIIPLGSLQSNLSPCTEVCVADIGKKAWIQAQVDKPLHPFGIPRRVSAGMASDQIHACKTGRSRT